MTIRTKALSLICVTLAGAILLFLITVERGPAAPSYIDKGSLDVTTAIAYWQRTIADKGPQAAYEEMVRDGEHISERHTLAHTFGEALYNTGDMSNIRYCGAGEFLYGCYHQFIGLASLENGTDVLSEMYEACTTLPNSGGCIHGVGHGLVSARDYTLPSIEAALADCKASYDSREDQGICADGVFMEYNLQEMTMLAEAGEYLRVPRPFTRESALEPCAQMGDFRTECTYELPLWWTSALSSTTSDIPTLAREMFELCRGLPENSSYRVTCNLGIGFPVAQRGDFAVPAIKLSCGMAPSHTEEIYCLAGAVRRFFENGIPHEHLCDDFGLGGTDAKYCKNVVAMPRTQLFSTTLE